MLGGKTRDLIWPVIAVVCGRVSGNARVLGFGLCTVEMLIGHSVETAEILVGWEML